MTSTDLIACWPTAPKEERPKSLFVNYTVDKECRDEMALRGWTVFDTRALPNKTDADRAEGVKAVLEGVRVGSIAPDREKLRWAELEAKVYGSLTGKDKLVDKTPQISQEVLDNLLDFGGKKAKIR